MDVITTYVIIDKIAEEAGRRVLRLLPHHCQYNSIELIWTQVETCISQTPLKWSILLLTL